MESLWTSIILFIIIINIIRQKYFCKTIIKIHKPNGIQKENNLRKRVHQIQYHLGSIYLVTDTLDHDALFFID